MANASLFELDTLGPIELASDLSAQSPLQVERARMLRTIAGVIGAASVLRLILAEVVPEHYPEPPWGMCVAIVMSTVVLVLLKAQRTRAACIALLVGGGLAAMVHVVSVPLFLSPITGFPCVAVAAVLLVFGHRPSLWAGLAYALVVIGLVISLPASTDVPQSHWMILQDYIVLLLCTGAVGSCAARMYEIARAHQDAVTRQISSAAAEIEESSHEIETIRDSVAGLSWRVTSDLQQVLWINDPLGWLPDQTPKNTTLAQTLSSLSCPELEATLEQKTAAGIRSDALECRSATGQRLLLRLSLEPVPQGGDLVGFAIDVSDEENIKARLERQLEADLQIRRIQTTGELAGRIAEDFRALLQSVEATVSEARSQLPADHPSVEHLRSVSTTRQALEEDLHPLTLFTGRSPTPNQEIILRDELEAIVAALTPEWPEVIRVDWGHRLDRSLRLHANAPTFREIVTPLLDNAARAMPDGGTIRISCTRYTNKICLEIMDTGVGMTAEVLSRCVDPYFSTREGAKGMGLSTAFALIHTMGGTLEIESHPGEGTGVTVVFTTNVSA